MSKSVMLNHEDDTAWTLLASLASATVTVSFRIFVTVQTVSLGHGYGGPR
jgi:hypothetical protein